MKSAKNNPMETLYLGDCLEEMKKIPDGSVDLVLTDPPYELGFMGKSWDSTGIANNVDVWKQCLRVLKPGGYLLSFGGTRTYHRMASAIEDAGFEVRDMIEWVYGSGFPKSRNIGKDIDKIRGNERKITGNLKAPGYAKKEVEMGKQNRSVYDFVTTKGNSEWEGWGTALKPAHEPICMARKPLSEKTVAENVLKYGTGGINIDESRVEINEDISNIKAFGSMPENKVYEKGFSRPWMNNKQSILDKQNEAINKMKSLGRFPANLIHDNSEEVRECFPNDSWRFFKECKWKEGEKEELLSMIYQAKASKSERNRGCEELPIKSAGGLQGRADGSLGGDPVTAHNNHPTVKPVALMEYLIKMVTRKGGIVLDPFMGSGTTGVACKNLNRNFIGIEKEEEYFKIANARINKA